jgi:tRNA A37 methylthiotransferase MiaB
MLARCFEPFNHGCPPGAAYLPAAQARLYNDRPMSKRASLHSLGCRLNQAETSILASQLRRQGYALVGFGEPTDLLVVNTCSVTEEAERNCRYAIRKTLKHSPDAFVAVTGCYAQTGLQSLRSIPGIDLIVGISAAAANSAQTTSAGSASHQKHRSTRLRSSRVRRISFNKSLGQNPGWLQCNVQFLSHSVCPRPRAKPQGR